MVQHAVYNNLKGRHIWNIKCNYNTIDYQEHENINVRIYETDMYEINTFSLDKIHK